MVQYDTMESAKEALNAVRGTVIGNSRKLMASGHVCIYVDQSVRALWAMGMYVAT